MNNETSETFINPEYGGSELSIMFEFYKHGTLCDMTILAEEERFYTHKLVLAICCKYFRDQIMRNPNKNDFQIPIDDETFKKILKYFYKGNIQLDTDSIQRLILATKLLELNILFDVSCEFLAKHLTADNFFDVKTFAETNSLHDLIDKINKYNEEQFSQISEKEKFLQLQLEDIVNILQNSKENIPSEDLFEKIVRWISADSERKQHLPTLLKLIDLTSMSYSFLEEKVQPYSEDSIESLKLVIEAYKNLKLKKEKNHPPSKTYKIMVIGGENDPIASYIDLYDPNIESWLETKVMNLKRTDFGVAKVQNHVIVVGGKQARKALNEVLAVNLETMKTNVLLPMENRRKNLCVSSILDEDYNIILYAIGGHNDTQYVNTVEKCHPVTRVWSNVSPMMAQRGCFTVVVIDNNIYAVGGKDDSGILKSVEVYSSKNDKWTACNPMNRARYYAGVAVIKNYMYVIGGSDDDGPVQSIERYDVKNDSWMMLDSSNYPQDLKYASASDFGDNIIVIGGRQAFSYNPENNTWVELPSLISSRHRALVLNVSMSDEKAEENLNKISFLDED